MKKAPKELIPIVDAVSNKKTKMVGLLRNQQALDQVGRRARVVFVDVAHRNLVELDIAWIGGDGSTFCITHIAGGKIQEEVIPRRLLVSVQYLDG